MNLFNSKKGFYMSARDWISFFVGLVVFAVGIIPLLNKFKVIPFGLPMSLPLYIFFFIMAFAGLYLIVDGFIEPAGHMLHTTLMILGFIFVIIGLIPILSTFKVIGLNVPFFGNLIFYNTILVIEGIMLMTAGFTMR